MSSSSRIYADGENPKIDLPVFVSPAELVFSISKKRALLTIYNPYGNEAQFKIMTTNPDRFDVSLTKGIIKPNRRIDITIRLLSHKIEELPEPTDEIQILDHFRISIQIGALKGNRQLKVGWIASVEFSEVDDASRLLGEDDSSLRVRLKSHKQPPAYVNVSSSQRGQQSSTSVSSRAGLAVNRARSQPQDHQAVVSQSGSNVNLICFLSAIVCIVLLFLPLAIDSELCKKAKLYQSDSNQTQPVGIMAQISNFLSVSYEMKFGCSFALGLFTYRLISTMPD